MRTSPSIPLPRRDPWAPAIGARAWLEGASRQAPWLWWCAVAMVMASFATALLVLVDPRSFNGVSVWLKPWKFQVSLAIHLFTLALCAVPLAGSPGFARRLEGMSLVAVVAGVFEVAYITWRASRGEASHFNVATPFAGAMYTLMGIGAVMLTACAGWLGWRVLREPGLAHNTLLRQGIGWGLVIGCALGTLSGAYVSAQTGHWVGGTPSDAVSVPVVGWSLDGGDLRVAHFFGLHAMQVLPLAAWALHRATAPARAVGAWRTFAAVYVGWTVFTFWQALAGRPVF
jgi:hypothetical protein